HALCSVRRRGKGTWRVAMPTTCLDVRRVMLAILRIKRREMEAAGLIEAGSLSSWNAFRRDPYRWLLRLDESDASALWKLIQVHKTSLPADRQSVRSRHGQERYRPVAMMAG